MIKEFWGKLGYFFFVGMLIIVGFLTGNLKVKGAELKSWAESGARVYVDDHGTLTPTSWQTNPYTFNVTYPVTNMQFRLRSTDGLSVENSYTFEFGYLPTPDAISVNRVYMKKTGDVENEDITCNTWRRNSNGYYLLKCSFVPREAYTSNEYLYVNIVFNQAYLTSIRSYVYGYDERLGTNAVITDTGNQIINNNNENTQDIINNINGATTIINNGLNGLTESQKVCTTIEYDSSNAPIGTASYFLSNLGNELSGGAWNISPYINFDSGSTLNLKTGGDSNASLCLYDTNNTIKECIQYTANGNFTRELNYSGKLRFSFNRSASWNLQLVLLKQCKNGNQALSDDLKDDSIDDPSGFIEDMEDLLPENGVITSLITLPITLFTKVLDSINGTCSAFDLGSLYGTHLIFPCIELSNYLGSTLINTIDIIMSGCFVLVIARKMIKAFEGFTSMKEGDVIND